MKKRNVFNYIFVLVIVILLSLPFMWKKYGLEIMNDIIYNEYIVSEEVKLIEQNESILKLEYNSDSDCKMYIHLIYSDYDKDIVEFDIIPGSNAIIIEKSKTDLRKVYIYLEDPINSYKWIVFES